MSGPTNSSHHVFTAKSGTTPLATSCAPHVIGSRACTHILGTQSLLSCLHQLLDDNMQS